MRTTFLFAAVSTALVVAPAAAQQTAEAVKKVGNEPTKMICKKFQGTGTRLKNRRVCATEEQWRQREQEDQELLNAIQASTRACEITNC